MLTYILIGLFWCFWLEYYTSGNESVELNGEWTMRERAFHTLVWPFSLSIFLYEFFRNLF